MVFGLIQRKQSSDVVVVTRVSKRPRAVVVIFGHIGITLPEISKYARVYHNQQCSTICATAPLLSLASNNVEVIGSVATTACREAARLIRMADLAEMGMGRVPVLIHVLGNGGAQVLEQLENRIREVIPASEFDKLLQPESIKASLSKEVSSRLLLKSTSSRVLIQFESVVDQQLPLEGSTGSLNTSTSISEASDEAEHDLKLREQIRAISRNIEFPKAKMEETLDKKGSTTSGFWPEGFRIPQCGNTDIEDNALPLRKVYPPPKAQGRRKRSCPLVERVDIERSGLSFLGTPQYNADDRAYSRDIKLFESRLAIGCVVFDSGPYFASMEKEMAAVDQLVSNPALKLLTQSALFGAYGMQSWTRFSYLGSEESSDGFGRASQFMNSMKNLHLSNQHAFIFSLADKICGREEMVELARSHGQLGIKTLYLELEESQHLQHLNQHKDRYQEFIGMVLDELDVCTVREHENVSSWFAKDGQHIADTFKTIET
jgi:hypothetical protein